MKSCVRFAVEMAIFQIIMNDVTIWPVAKRDLDLNISSGWISHGSFGLFWVADKKEIEREKHIKKKLFTDWHL